MILPFKLGVYVLFKQSNQAVQLKRNVGWKSAWLGLQYIGLSMAKLSTAKFVLTLYRVLNFRGSCYKLNEDRVFIMS